MVFGIIKIHAHYSVKMFQFFFVKIILGDRNISSPYISSFPRGKHYTELGGVVTVKENLSVAKEKKSYF